MTSGNRVIRRTDRDDQHRRCQRWINTCVCDPAGIPVTTLYRDTSYATCARNKQSRNEQQTTSLCYRTQHHYKIHWFPSYPLNISFSTVHHTCLQGRVQTVTTPTSLSLFSTLSLNLSVILPCLKVQKHFFPQSEPISFVYQSPAHSIHDALTVFPPSPVLTICQQPESPVPVTSSSFSLSHPFSSLFSRVPLIKNHHHNRHLTI